ncbi:MAG: TatD family hydrolase [Candidatus Omnitrophica bacterium]|nr:TatD family hydrolase [Candidatus Omnitrophota bacterium]
MNNDMYIDTHCHLNFPDFDGDRDEVVKEAERQGVAGVVNIGTGIETSRESIEISNRYGIVYPTAGIHPTDVENLAFSDMKLIENLAKNEKVRGIGETGLDFYYGRSFEEKQKDFFSAHIEIAGKLNLPLVIHQRESRDEVIDIIEKGVMPEKVVFHCFGGDAELAEYCRKKGFYISFTGIITFKKADDVKEVCRKYPLELIMAETDAPFLAPVPYRGKRNDPSKVRYVVEAIANVKGMGIKECAERIFLNSREFFNLGSTLDT